MTDFSKFETWALSLPVPALNLPALENPTEIQLAHRAVDIAFDIGERTEQELASGLILLGSLDYLEERVCP